MNWKIIIGFFVGLIWADNRPDTLLFKGSLTDSLFLQDSALTVEVLETGHREKVMFQEPFQVSLPYDSVWNLCVTGTAYEQCYKVQYHGEDTTFFAPLTDVQEVVFFEAREQNAGQTQEWEKVERRVDTTVVSESETSEALDERTRMRKVVLRIKKRPKRALGQSTVSAKSIKRMPGLAEADVVKAIQALPGVVASSDFSSKIYVRGGGADQNLFLFDEGVVYSPVHFFGLFSTFLVEGIDEVNFYKGGFSPKYGNRLSSVVDISSRKGGSDSLDLDIGGSVKVSTFASQVHLEGRTRDFRFLGAGRSTYIKEVVDFLRKRKLTKLKLNYRFYDLQGSVFWEPHADKEASLSAYVGQDKLIFDIVNVNWSNLVIPFNYYERINEHWEFYTSIAYSHFDQEYELKDIVSFINKIDSWSVKPYGVYHLGDETRLIHGLEYKYIKNLFGQKLGTDALDKTDPNMHIVSPYLDILFSVDAWDFKLGARANYQDPLKQVTWEPRASARYNIDDRQNIDIHAGYYQQYINSILFGDFEMFNEFYYPSGKEKTQTVKPTSSLLLSLGYSIDPIWTDYNFTAETYFKTLNNNVIFDPSSKPDSIRNDSNATLGEFLFFGEGYSYGLELAVNKKTGPLQGGVSYSYGVAVLKGLQSTMFANWDVPHSWKLNAQINWKGKVKESLWPHKKTGRYFRSSTQLKISEGAPYTGTVGYYQTNYIDQGEGGGEAGSEENLALQLGCRNCERYPRYFRWDIKLVDMGRYDKWNFTWTLLNVTNRVNVFSYFYDTNRPPKRSQINQFPFFPMLFNYEYHF